MTCPPDYASLPRDVQLALLHEFNEHVRKTEEKYLGIFVAYIAGATALIVARPPGVGSMQLELWQLTLLALAGFVGFMLMWRYRAWKERYHQHIEALLSVLGMNRSPFRPMGGDDLMLWSVAVTVVVAVIAAVIAAVKAP